MSLMNKVQFQWENYTRKLDSRSTFSHLLHYVRQTSSVVNDLFEAKHDQFQFVFIKTHRNGHGTKCECTEQKRFRLCEGRLQVRIFSIFFDKSVKSNNFRRCFVNFYSILLQWLTFYLSLLVSLSESQNNVKQIL